MKAEFRESFKADLEKVRNAKLLVKVRKAIENVEDANSPQEIRNFKKLKGSKTHYRIRIGDYRVGLRIDGDTIVFVRFLSRKEIYRFFP
ncbi:MAG: type II toxin-antitoxin system mRNA interferase toxin, RelE/StbE family [Acidobacteriota bacterium]